MVTLADRIRKHVMERHVRPFLKSDEATLSIRAGDVVRGMGLVNRTPNVCSALEGRRFQQEAQRAGLAFVGRTGPHRSTTTTFHYERVGTPKTATLRDATRQKPLHPQPKTIVTKRTSGPRAKNAKLPAADLCLVSCVSKKQVHPAPAKELYISDWFMKVRTLVETQGWPWFILSAQHGLVHPDKEIAAYEKTLNAMRVAERQAWANMVMEELKAHVDCVQSVVVFAGEKYREFLVPEMQERGIQVHVPMEGLKIGEQLAWLNDRIKPCP